MERTLTNLRTNELYNEVSQRPTERPELEVGLTFPTADSPESSNMELAFLPYIM